MLSDNPTLLFLPLIAAFIGWLTNYLAVKMLFHPREEIRVLGFPIQGVFPKRQDVLAAKLGDVVATELFSAEEVIEKLKAASHSTEMLDFIAPRVEQMITQDLPKQIPMLAMVLNAELVETLKNTVMGLLTPLIDGMLEKIQGRLEQDLDVRGIVEAKVSGFSGERLEEMLNAIMKREFRFIEILGGVLGFFIGCVQVALILYF